MPFEDLIVEEGPGAYIFWGANCEGYLEVFMPVGFESTFDIGMFAVGTVDALVLVSYFDCSA